MQALTVHLTTPPVEVYFVDCYEDNFGLPDGQFVTLWQAYCPITNLPIGPRHGDFNPEYVRLWMREKHPAAIEVLIATIPIVTETVVR